MRGRTLACSLLAACVLAPSAAGGRGLLVGVADDGLKWQTRSQAHTALGFVRDLNLSAIRVTVTWHPGQSRLSTQDRKPVDRAIVASFGLRVVLAVYGRPDDAPQDDGERIQYCRFVASLLQRYPSVRDVVIWNEPNVSRFWRPQFAQDGSSAAPAAYAALLATCFDVLHAVRPGMNVIAASAPRGNDRPSAVSNASHSPVNFYRKLGEAYREMGRTRPLFDVVGHNAYPTTNTERPWTRHASGSSIAQGDYERLLSVLEEAFGGTGQPLPGQGHVSIWYLEQGFQTTIDESKRALYHGVETDRHALPPVSTRTASSSSGPAPDQATQLADALRLAYCQPAVGGFFNFELADEPSLAGWQSGVLWTDLTPKPSYLAFKQAIAEVNAGAVDCTRFERLAAPKSAPKADEPEDQIGFAPKKPTKKKPKKKIPVVAVK